MAKIEDRIIQRLEAQVERAQARLSPEPQRSSPIGFLGGLALGTVAGALLTFFFTRDEEDLPDNVASGEDDSIVLRERATGSHEQASAPRPLVAMPTSPEEGVTNQLAAAELESPEAVKDIAHEAASTNPKAVTPGQTNSATVDTKPTATPPDQAKKQAVSSAAPTAQPAEAEETQKKAPAATSGKIDPIGGVCPATHPIKGNKGSMGALIYHNHESASYERTIPEVCFATEQDAEAAGYRAPRG